MQKMLENFLRSKYLFPQQKLHEAVKAARKE
jgi:hypothetical protein